MALQLRLTENQLLGILSIFFGENTDFKSIEILSTMEFIFSYTNI